MLICASIHPRLGMYYHSGCYGRYVRKADSWRSGPTPRGDRAFADSALRQKVAEVSIDRVTEQADLVFVGTVESMSESTFSGPDGSTAAQLTVMFAVDEVRKGVSTATQVPVAMLTAGMYLPAWRKHVPNGFEVGQRWLCFLKKNEVGWYPFAGSNGLLRVEADQLIYDNRDPLWHTKAAVDQTLRGAGER
jgi:hypothetical protein